jgi:transposase InsO family protein
VVRDDEDALTRAVVDLANEYGRCGYRRVTVLLRLQDWRVNHKRVERISRHEGLKVPQKQPKRGRLWLNDGPCVRRRSQRRHHAWSYDFVMDRTHDGRRFRMLTVIDEYSRECLAIRSERRQNQERVPGTLADLFLLHGPPDYFRSDNGAEFTATAVREWLHRLDVPTLFIEPGTAGHQYACHACIGYATVSTGSHFRAGLVLRGRSVNPRREIPRSAPDSCRDDLGSAACLSLRHRHQDAAAIFRARRLDRTIEFPILRYDDGGEVGDKPVRKNSRTSRPTR